jgi:hypothetical protein
VAAHVFAIIRRLPLAVISIYTRDGPAMILSAPMLQT